MTDRRTFLGAGLAGSALLAAGGLAAWLAGRDPARDRNEVLAAVMPALLEGALPEDEPARAQALAHCADAVGAALAGLAPAAQKEAAQLFGLLATAPGRALLAGVAGSWERASPGEVHGFLQRWRVHEWALLRSGYQALHDLVLGAWYAHEAHWQAIGYRGPVRL